MAKTPKTVNNFLADVHKVVAPLEQKEVQELRAFKAKTLNISLEKAEINRWNVGYWSEKLRKDKYQIDQEKLRDYFPTLAAQKWLFAISEICMVFSLKLPKWIHGNKKSNITML
jgi:thimet oligopeptidase